MRLDFLRLSLAIQLGQPTFLPQCRRLASATALQAVSLESLVSGRGIVSPSSKGVEPSSSLVGQKSDRMVNSACTFPKRGFRRDSAKQTNAQDFMSETSMSKEVLTHAENSRVLICSLEISSRGSPCATLKHGPNRRATSHAQRPKKSGVNLKRADGR